MKAIDLIKEIYDFEMENCFPPSKIHLSQSQIDLIANEFNITELAYPCSFRGIPVVVSETDGPHFSA